MNNIEPEQKPQFVVNANKVTRNTILLYFRQILILLVSLYSVRIVLSNLGAIDYGIYNVVAGVVTMFGFLSGAMATASQRYFSFELGRQNIEQLKKTFNISFIIYVCITVILLCLAETIGVWFVYTKLNIPIDRLPTARWVYQFSIISFVFTIMATPYMALIIAHEDMNIYAYLSIAEASLKLLIAFVLPLLGNDKLFYYGLMLALSVVMVTTLYRYTARRKYKECKESWYWDWPLFKEILSYTGWNTFGALVGVFKNQGINIVLNQYFNPIIVASRGIAYQVNSAVSSFAQNFSTAVRPQIIKSYAVHDITAMRKVVFQSCKTTFILMYLLTLPLVLEMQFVLRLWLKNPPDYAVIFTQLALLDALVESISFPIMTVAQATGKIKLYQSVVGGLLLLNLPISLIFIAFGYPAESVFIIAIILSAVAFIVRLLIVRQLVDFSIISFFRQVIMPLIITAFISLLVPLYVHNSLQEGFVRFVITGFLSVVSIILFTYTFALSKEERSVIARILKRK